MNFEQLRNFTFPKDITSSRGIFDALKKSFSYKILKLITERKKLNRGPKPNREIILKVLDALFYQLDNGSKVTYIEQLYCLSRGTYYRYLKIISEQGLFQELNKELLENYAPPKFLIVDATHIRSICGSEEVQYGYKEHGKKATKLTILSDKNKIIYLNGNQPDNMSDHLAFEKIAQENPLAPRVTLDILADAGYSGKEFKMRVKNIGYNVISAQKKKSKVILSVQEKQLLKTHRVTVEHVFAHLKSKRGLQIKCTKKMWTFRVLVDLAILINNIHFGLVKNNLSKKIKVKLTRKQ